MRRTALFTAAGLVAAVTVGTSQVPVGPPGSAPLLPPGGVSPTGHPTPLQPPAGTVPAYQPDPSVLQPTRTHIPSPNIPPSRSPEPTVEQLIEALERLKVQKAELDKQEQLVKDALAKKLAVQGERLKKLGVGEKADMRKE